MITLLELRALNFKRLCDLTVRFPEQGAVLIEGRNEAGKSTLFEAFYFALYGDPLLEPDIDPFPEGYLERLGDVFPGYGGAQDGGAVGHVLPGGGQDVRVGHAVQAEGGLLEVDVLVVLGQAVEGHAGLHGGQGVDVVDVVAVAG